MSIVYFIHQPGALMMKLHRSMAELVDAPDLKSVGHYARGGSIPPIPINNTL